MVWYSVKYRNGRLILSVGSHAAEDFEGGQTQSVCMSVKDWKLFHSAVCSDLDQPSFSETVYVSQWVGASGPELYRMLADRFSSIYTILFF